MVQAYARWTEKLVTVKSYVLTHAMGLKPSTSISIEIDGKLFEENSSGDGQFDGFMNALKKVYKKKDRN